MSILTAAVAFTLLGGAIGYLAAWWIHGVPTPTDVAEYMDKVVSTEEVEAREMHLRSQLQRSGYHTLPNPESGRPIRIHKASVTKGETERQN